MNEQSTVGKYIWRQVIPHSVMRALPELWIRCSGKGLAFTGHYSCVNKDTSPRGLVVFYYLNVFMFSKTSARGRVLFQKQICSNFCLEGKRWQAVWLSATDLKELNSKTGFTHYMTFCCCSVTKSCLTLWDPIDCSTPGSPVLHYLLELLRFTSIELVMLSNHLILCRPLLLLSILSSIRIFSNELALCTGGQSIGVSVSASVHPRNIQDWFPLGWTGLISLQSRGPSRVSSSTTM